MLCDMYFITVGVKKKKNKKKQVPGQAKATGMPGSKGRTSLGKFPVSGGHEKQAVGDNRRICTVAKREDQ